MTRHILAALLLAAAALPASAGAQSTGDAVAALPPETRVRVTAPAVARRPLAGRIVNSTPDTVFISQYSGLVAVPTAAITRADVSRGRDHLRGFGQGALRGAAVGGVVLGALVFARDLDCDYCLSDTRLEAVAAGVLIGAYVGAPGGGIIGLIGGVEEWEPVGGGVAVRVVPVPDGRLGIGFTLRGR